MPLPLTLFAKYKGCPYNLGMGADFLQSRERGCKGFISSQRAENRFHSLSDAGFNVEVRGQVVHISILFVFKGTLGICGGKRQAWILKQSKPMSSKHGRAGAPES